MFLFVTLLAKNFFSVFKHVMTLSVLPHKIFRSFGRRQLAKSASNSDDFFKKQIDGFKDSELREQLTKIINFFGEEGRLHTCGLSFVDNFIRKYNLCEDKKIKKIAKQWIVEPQNKDIEVLTSNTQNAELLLDAVNSACGKYSNLYIPEIVMLNKKIVRNKYLWSESRLSGYYLGSKNIENNAFQTHNRFANMINFIKNNPDETELSQYLWEKYYIPHIKSTSNDSCETINKMFDIKNKYGTFIYMDSKTPETNIVLNFVRDEFKMWKQAGKDKVKFPIVLDLSEFNSSFAIHKDFSGICNPYEESIGIKRYHVQDAFRHEMTHLNDLKLCGSNKPIKLSPFEELEMIKAGLSRGQINYAKNCQDDKKAVFAEGDMSRYSTQMKKHMIEEGVPEFVTTLPFHKDNFIYKKMYTKTYGNDNTAKIMKILKSKFYDSAFESLFSCFLENGFSENEVKYLFRHKTTHKYHNLKEYFDNSYSIRLTLFYINAIEFIKKPIILLKELF